MTKRLISFLMATILFSSLFGMNTVAFAESEAYKEAHMFLQAIGAVSEKEVQYSAKVKKTEFAVYLADLLYPGNSFSDKLAVENLVAHKYFSDEYFKDGVTINSMDAIIALIKVLGQEKSVRNGQGEAGYLRVANNIGLTDSVDIAKSLDYANMFILFNNALYCDFYDIQAIAKVNDKITYTYSNNGTLLGDVYGIYYIDDIVTANHYASLYDNLEITNENEIRIGDKLFSCNDIDYSNLLGLNIRAFYKNENGIYELVYVKENQNDIILIHSEELEFKGNTLSYYDDKGRARKINTGILKLVHNGVAQFDKSILERVSLLTTPNTVVKFIKGDGESSYNVAIAETYKYGIVKSISKDDEIIVFEKETLSLNKKDFVQIMRNDGQKSHLSAIKAGDLIAYSCSENYAKIYISDKLQYGMVNSISKDGYFYTFEIDGTDYKVSKTIANAADVRAGKYISFKCDPWGKIAYLSLQDDLVGYVYARGTNNDVFDTSNYKYKIFTQNGEHLIVEMAKRVELNGNKDSSANAEKALENIDGTFAKQLVLYRLNSKNELIYLRTCKNDSEFKKIGANNKRKFRKDTVAEIYMFEENINSLTGEDLNWELKYGEGFPMDGATLRFNIAPDEHVYDENYYSITNVCDFEHNFEYKVEFYKINDDSDFVDIVLTVDDYELRESSTQNEPCIVRYINRVLSNEGNVTSSLGVHYNSFIRDASDELIADESVDIMLVDGIMQTVNGEDIDKYIGCGDIIQVVKSGRNVFGYIKVIYDHDLKTTFWEYDEPGGQPTYKYESISYNTLMKNTENTRYVYGFVYDKYQDNLFYDKYDRREYRKGVILTLGNNETNEIMEMTTCFPPADTPWVTMYDETGRKPRVYAASLADIVSWENLGKSETNKMEVIVIYIAARKYFFFYE